MPAWSARPCQVDAPTAVRVDRGAHRDGPVEVGERPSLLDVQLDERADPAQRLRIGTQRRVARARDRLGHRHAVGVGEPGGPVGGQRAGEDPRARAGDAEPGAFLVAEEGHAQRPGRGEPLRAQGVDRGERADDAERAVERAAVGHRIQVGAGDDAGPVRVGIAPPGDEVAGPVGGDVEPPCRGLAGEPLPQVGVLPGPGEPPVPAGAAAPEVGEVGEARPGLAAR